MTLLKWDEWNKDVVMPVGQYLASLDYDQLNADNIEHARTLLPDYLRSRLGAVGEMAGVDKKSFAAFVRYLLITLVYTATCYTVMHEDTIVVAVTLENAGNTAHFTFNDMYGGRVQLYIDGMKADMQMDTDDANVSFDMTFNCTQYLSNSHLIEKFLGMLA